LSRNSKQSRAVSRLRCLVLASLAVGAALAAVPSVGQANFTTGQCLGADVTGRGASFANAAHTAWKTVFQNDYCADVGSPIASRNQRETSGWKSVIMGGTSCREFDPIISNRRTNDANPAVRAIRGASGACLRGSGLRFAGTIPSGS